MAYSLSREMEMPPQDVLLNKKASYRVVCHVFSKIHMPVC